MSYSVTTQDGYTLQGIPDGLKPNSPEVLAEIEKLRARERATVAQKEKEERPTSRIRSSNKPDSGMLENIAKGFGSGVTGMLESSALGAATLLEEDAELKARSKIQEFFDIDMLKGADEDSISYKLSSGIGSIAALAPAALAGPAALPLAGAVAAGAGAGEASERARAYGATEEERSSAALRGTAIGLTEVTPLGRLSKAFKLPGITKTLNKLGPKAVKGIASRVRNAAVTGLAEGAQEGAAAILQNLNEQGYNPERELVDAGVLEEALIGGGAGAILQALVDVLVKGKTKGTPKDTPLGEEAPVVSEEAPVVVGEETPDTAEGAPVVEKAPVEKISVEEAGVDPVDVDEVAGERLGATKKEKAPRLDATKSETTVEKAKELRTLKVTVATLQKKVDASSIEMNVETEATDLLNQGKTPSETAQEVTSHVGRVIETGATDVGTVNETRSRDSVPTDPQAPEITKEATTETKGAVVGRVEDSEQGATDTDAREDGQPASVDETPTGERLIDSVTFDQRGQVEGGQTAAAKAKALEDQKKSDAQQKLENDKELGERRQLVDRGAAVDISVRERIKNLRSNTKITAKEAVTQVTNEIEALEVEIAAQEATKGELTEVVEGAIVPKPVSSETSPLPADRSVVVDNKFVSSIGLTGSNKVFGDRLVAKFGSDTDTGGVVTNRELAISLRDNSDKQGIYKLTYAEAPAEGQEKGKLITKSYDTKAEQSKAASNAVKTGATEVKTPTLKPVKLNSKAQAYVDKYAGEPVIKEEAVPAESKDDTKDKVLLSKAGKDVGSEVGDKAAKILTPLEMDKRSQEVIDKEGVEQFVEPNLRVVPKNETSEQKVERQRLLAEEDQVFVDQIEDVLGGANAFREYSKLPAKYINMLDGVIPSDIKKLLKKGNLSDALTALSVASTDPRVKKIARVLATAVGTTKVRFADGADSFVSTDGTVNIGEGEIFVHTVLHEATHSAVNKLLDKGSHPATKKIETLFKEVKPLLDTAYGATDVKEFVSEAMSNSEFQQKLAGMNPDGSPINALDRLFRVITNFLRSLIGLDTKATGSALDVTDQAIIALLSTSPDTRGAGGTYANATRDGVEKIVKELGLIQKGFPAPTPKFKEEFGNKGATWLDSVEKIATKMEMLALLDTQAVGDVAQARGYKEQGNQLHVLIQEMRGSMNQSDEYIKKRVEKVAKWAMTPEGRVKNEIMGNLIYSRDHGATITQVDPTIKTLAEAKIKYAKDPEKVEIWKEQRNDWNALGKDGQDIYVYLRDTYKEQYEQMKRVITGRMTEVVGKKEAEKLQTSVFDKLFDKNTLEVYFPLVRSGKFKLSYTPKQDGTVKPDRDNYVVEMFESEADRNKALAEVKKEGATGIVTTDGDLTASSFKNAPDAGFVNEVLTILTKNGVESAVQDDVMNLFINALPETALAKSLKGRSNIAGYDKDPLVAMRTRAFDIGRQVQRIESSGKIRALTSAIQKTQKDLLTNNVNSATTTAIGNELLSRANFAINGSGNKSLEGKVKNINQLAFIYTIGFNASSALVNLSQLGLVVGPMLGAEFGHIKTGKTMTEAMALVASSGNTIQSYFDMTMNKKTGEFEYTLRKDLDPTIVKEFGPLKTLITMASSRSYLTQSYIADAMGLDEGTQTFEVLSKALGIEASGRISQEGNFASKALNSVSSISAYMFNAGEKFNRQVTLLASYKLSLDNIQTREASKPKDQRMSTTQMELEASEDALYKSMEYNGGAVLETGSRISREGVGRVAFMYKNYGLRMYTTMFKAGRQALELSFAPKKGETAAQKEERIRQRKIAWGKLRAIHLAALLIAGIQGMPLYGAVALLMDLTLDDDEDDADTVVRKYFGEGWYKGPLVDAMGVDFSKRVRLNSLLFEANRYSRDPSVEENIFHHLGGPAFSTGKRLLRAYGDFSEGEVQRGIESTLPAGLTNIVRNSPLGRIYQDDAMKTRRGDVIYDDLTAGDFFAGMVGFPPTGYTFAQEQTNVEQKISGAVTKKRSKLLKQYYVARRQGDYPEVRRLRTEMTKFGKKHPSARITYDSLKRSYRGHQRTTAKMHNGTTISPMMKRVLEAERKEYDTSSLFE